MLGSVTHWCIVKGSLFAPGCRRAVEVLSERKELKNVTRTAAAFQNCSARPKKKRKKKLYCEIHWSTRETNRNNSRQKRPTWLERSSDGALCPACARSVLFYFSLPPEGLWKIEREGKNDAGGKGKGEEHGQIHWHFLPITLVHRVWARSAHSRCHCCQAASAAAWKTDEL